MSKKTPPKTSKPAGRKADIKAHAPRRRTRMIALEPRMLFDGALGLDLSAQATAVAMGDASAKADAMVTPATPEATRSAPAAPAPGVPVAAADKDVTAKPGADPAPERPSEAAAPSARHEIVFI